LSGKNRGIISQAPQVLTCATARKLKNLKNLLGQLDKKKAKKIAQSFPRSVRNIPTS
jgi:hypothetical protein